MKSVNSDEGYNEVQTNKEKLITSIRLNKDIPRQSVIETYIGMCVVNLHKVKPKQGSSKFFDSVFIPGLDSIYGVNLDRFDYWDFGTLSQYFTI